MFGKKKDELVANENDGDMAAPPLKPFSRKGSHAASKPPTSASYQPEVPRRVPDIAGVSPRRMERPIGGDGDSKRLVVGRDIRLSGEITACDKLVVEGHVEVSLPGARVIEISQSGYFKGTADVEEADISGRFEGELIARDRLVVRAGGRISGTIRYGRIVIESGGEISGDMQTLDSSTPARADGSSSSPDDTAA
ncbi:MAG: polymer-forming cytoskeletal protein [Rhodospirillales bacterium]|nr:polymer-forming cytoskeletal protein [Rhodospirillales bacterium]